MSAREILENVEYALNIRERLKGVMAFNCERNIDLYIETQLNQLQESK